MSNTDKQRILKCFVASAFGYDDVDAIYNQVITPALGKIKALRVDLVNHNDDIDDKIIEFINICDFCIADLTYARPSVYYEAGRVHGLGKPVIFISRSDHFKQKADDTHGNFRIHFDLQMKNIIKWTAPNDKVRSELSKRINLVIRPIINKIEKEKEQRNEEDEFSRLPQNDKIKFFHNMTKTALILRKYKIIEEAVFFEQPGKIRAIKKYQKRVITVTVIMKSSFSKKDLIGVNRLTYFAFPGKDDATTQYYILCSLRTITPNNISDTLRSFGAAGDGKNYKSKDHNIHIVDGIRSARDFEERLNIQLNLISTEQKTPISKLPVSKTPSKLPH